MPVRSVDLRRNLKAHQKGQLQNQTSRHPLLRIVADFQGRLQSTSALIHLSLINGLSIVEDKVTEKKGNISTVPANTANRLLMAI